MKLDALIVGAGAAGLMCARTATARGRKVLILDHGKRAGQKILMSGGGKCNFTNLVVRSEHFVSDNPHFCKSALKQFSQWDFLQMIQEAGIAYEEREHGQLFTLKGADHIVKMLLEPFLQGGGQLQLGMTIAGVQFNAQDGFIIKAHHHNSRETITYSAPSLVVATGGLSYPSAGASPLGYNIATQFGLSVVDCHAALVPFCLAGLDREVFGALSGIAVPARMQTANISFTENLLFTHRGLSGPVTLQTSNYWKPGEKICIDLLPGKALIAELRKRKTEEPKKIAATVLNEFLPKRLVAAIMLRAGLSPLAEKKLADLSHFQLETISTALQNWMLIPAGTQGYRVAEVTRGGVDTRHLSSQTMEVKCVPGLYFVGEVLDITGWLGGYNLQWAWSSGWCAGSRL